MGVWIVFGGGILIGMCLLCIIGGIVLDIKEKRGKIMDFDNFFAWGTTIITILFLMCGCVGGIWFLIEKIVR